MTLERVSLGRLGGDFYRFKRKSYPELTHAYNFK